MRMQDILTDLAFYLTAFQINCNLSTCRVKPINCDLFLFFAITINWRLFWQRSYALISTHLIVEAIVVNSVSFPESFPDIFSILLLHTVFTDIMTTAKFLWQTRVAPKRGGHEQCSGKQYCTDHCQAVPTRRKPITQRSQQTIIFAMQWI